MQDVAVLGVVRRQHRDAEDVDVLGEPLAELGQLLRDLG
jgi:hypothetical protein